MSGQNGVELAKELRGKNNKLIIIFITALISMIINGNIKIDEFVLCFGAVGSFAGWISGIFNEVISINKLSLSICDFRDYLKYPERNNKNKGCEL